LKLEEDEGGEEKKKAEKGQIRWVFMMLEIDITACFVFFWTSCQVAGCRETGCSFIDNCNPAGCQKAGCWFNSVPVG